MSARSASTVTSVDPLQTSRPGVPCARNRSTASKAARSPRSSPHRRRLPVNVFATQRRAARRPCRRRPAAARARAGPARPPARPPRPLGQRLAHASNVADGSAVRRVCTATAAPLSSTYVPSPAPQHVGQPAPGLRHGGQVLGRGHGAALPALQARSGRARPGRVRSAMPPYSTAVAAGRPVTTATRIPAAASRVRTCGDVGVAAGRVGVRHDRRQGAVEVQTQQRCAGSARSAASPARPGSVVGRVWPGTRPP